MFEIDFLGHFTEVVKWTKNKIQPKTSNMVHFHKLPWAKFQIFTLIKKKKKMQETYLYHINNIYAIEQSIKSYKGWTMLELAMALGLHTIVC